MAVGSGTSRSLPRRGDGVLKVNDDEGPLGGLAMRIWWPRDLAATFELCTVVLGRGTAKL